jgi:hypothetical protein
MKLRHALYVTLIAAALVNCRAAVADAVLDWNEIGLAQVLATRQAPPDGARSLAMMHVAMFDAINAIEQKYRPYAHEAKGASEASSEAAAASAAHTVLSKLFPDQAQKLDAAYASSLSKISDGNAKTAGIALGQAVGAECIEMRTNDGAGAPSLYKPRITRGVYSATAYPVSSEWSKVKPFFMREPTQFRPAPPPALTSPEWSRDLEEIRTMGGKSSTSRNPEQGDVARFWAITGPASWNPIVRSLAQSRNASLIDNARLFAMVNMAAADSFVAVFDAKYAYEFWRPITAIRYEHADSGAWLPLVDTPMHPEYPCAHCISAAAVAAVLESQFGNDAIAVVTMESPTAPGVTRKWTRIGDYVQEVKNERIWGGIHYRTSADVGEAMGRNIGELAVRSFMTPVKVAESSGSR